MNIQTEKRLDEGLLKLANLFEERNFNKLETNTLLIGSFENHMAMIELLENNPEMSEEEFLKEARKMEAKGSQRT